MCRQCPLRGSKYGEPSREQYCICGCSQVKNGRCERCGHSLDFYKRDDTYRPKYDHLWQPRNLTHKDALEIEGVTRV